MDQEGIDFDCDDLGGKLEERRGKSAFARTDFDDQRSIETLAGRASDAVKNRLAREKMLSEPTPHSLQRSACINLVLRPN